MKVIFCKDNFHIFQIKEKIGQKSSFTKTIFKGKIVFKKDDFESVYFSNKHQKSHVWPKNIKKSIF